MKQFGVEMYCCLSSRNEGGNTEVGCGPWGKGGHVIRDSRGDGSGCVAEEQNDLQRVSSIVDRERF